ncbi:14145_t:CDS:2 [Gigaspora margarita]|uniref:14145_t:CDS:1 n=1 Tax=Gigaspora margarita TaxID=4874 RepID=A0ABN7UDU5_GIGMA|nr:14145_t:CDS:2 [Gigaspora margarita]
MINVLSLFRDFSANAVPELATGKRAFDGEPFDIGLFDENLPSERPGFNNGTPRCYVELAKGCIEPDPNKRPTAINICQRIGYWHEEMEL